MFYINTLYYGEQLTGNDSDWGEWVKLVSLDAFWTLSNTIDVYVFTNSSARVGCDKG